MKLADSVDEMIFDLLEVPIEDKDVEGTADNTTIDGNVFTDYLWLKKQFVQKWSLMCEDDYTQLRGFYTRQWQNAEAPTYKLYYGEDSFSTDSKTGQYIQIDNDTDFPAPITNFAIKGETIQGKLPAGYTQLDYIENTDTSMMAYFDTGVQLGTSNFEISAGVKFTATLSSESPILSIWTSTYDYWNLFKTGGNIDCYTQAHNIITNGATVGTWFDYKLKRSGTSWTLSDGVHTDITWTYSPSNTNNTTLKINARGDVSTGHKTSAQYSYIKIIVGETVVKDYIPAMRNSDRKIGFFDLIGQTFIASVGTNDFTAGHTIPSLTAKQTVFTTTGQNNFQIVGKNLFDKNAITSNKLIYRTSGDEGTNYSYGASDYIPVEAGQKYTYTGFNYWYSAFYDANRVFHSTPPNTATITIPSGVKYLRTSVLLTNLDTAQFEKGQSATEYEDFKQKSLEINLGKNMLDPSWMVAGYMTATGGGITYAQTAGEMACTEFIPVEPDTEYTFEIFKTTDTYGEWFGVSQYSTADESGFIERSVKTGASPQTWFFTFRTKANTRYIRPSARNLKHATEYQLSKGGRTTYAEYFVPIELCKIGAYQDYLYKSGDDWFVHKKVGKVVLDGSEAGWDLANITQKRYPFGIQIDGKKYSVPTVSGIMCDSFWVNSSSELDVAEQYDYTVRGTIYNTNLWFFCPKSDFSSSTLSDILNEWKTKIGELPITVFFVLDSATDTKITNSALISQLDAVLDTSLYIGKNNITTSTLNVPPSLDIEFKLIFSKETIIQDTTPVRLSLTDGGVINPCGCRQNVQIIMRETAQ